MVFKTRAVPNGVKACEAEQLRQEATSRTGTETEHEAHTRSGIPGRD